MIVVSVLYPAKAGSKFDMKYYLGTHMKMVEAAWTSMGMTGYQVIKGQAAGGGGEPPYQVVTNLEFDSVAAFEAAVAAQGASIMGDVPNFTDAEPTLQISEVVARYPG